MRLRLTKICSIFPSHHIDGVGTLQDAGLLENDPELWARSEVAALFPHLDEPDFVVSLGTGEPAASSYDVSTEDCRKRGMFHRALDLVWELSRGRVVRRVSSMADRSASYRLNLEFDGPEPGLDDTSSIPGLMSKVQTDAAVLCPKIDAIARHMVASLFYFELLDYSPCIGDSDMYVLTGQIMCSIRRSDPALEALLVRLTSGGGRFAFNRAPITGAATRASFLGADGNFQVRVDATTHNMLAITLELDGMEACHIGGSPFSVEKLVAVQGLDAPFGRPDHRKRKRSNDDKETAAKKKLRLAVE
jgi:hypothetical protein